MHKKSTLLFCLILSVLFFQHSAIGTPFWLSDFERVYQNDPENASRQWYQQAGFGMFVHLNLASLCENGKDDYVAWKKGEATERLLDFVGVSRKDYENAEDRDELLYERYTLKKFNPDAICRLAKKAEMKYITFTTHHLGGCYNFNTSLSERNSLNSPCKRDLVAEMAKACRKHNIALFLYVPPQISQTNGEWWEHNRTYLKELLTQYGDVAGIWYDGIGGFNRNPENYDKLLELHAYVKSLQPHALISFKEGALGDEDFISPEHFLLPFKYTWNDEGIQKRFEIRVDRWEKPYKEKWELKYHNKLREINTVMQKCRGRDDVGGDGGWINDESATHLTAKEVYNWLSYAESLDANLLMNIGPRSDGSIHPDDVDALTKVGKVIRLLK